MKEQYTDEQIIRMQACGVHPAPFPIDEISRGPRA
jgi:hypothetical protein